MTFKESTTLRRAFSWNTALCIATTALRNCVKNSWTRLAGYTGRATSIDEVKELHREAHDLMEVVTAQMIELRLLKKKHDGGYSTDYTLNQHAAEWPGEITLSFSRFTLHRSSAIGHRV